jgi:hypothetical protein
MYFSLYLDKKVGVIYVPEEPSVTEILNKAPNLLNLCGNELWTTKAKMMRKRRNE